MRNGASNRLFNERERLDPEEVFDLVEAEIREELDPFLDQEDDPLQALLLEDCNTMREAVKECRELYQKQPEEAARMMVESENVWTQLIGEAIISEDYCGLAI